MCPGLDMYCTDPAQKSHNGTVGSIDDLDYIFVDHLYHIAVDYLSVDHLSI